MNAYICSLYTQTLTTNLTKISKVFIVEISEKRVKYDALKYTYTVKTQ